MKKITYLFAAAVLFAATASFAQEAAYTKEVKTVDGARTERLVPVTTTSMSTKSSTVTPDAQTVKESRDYLTKNTTAGAPIDDASAVDQANKVKAMKAKEKTNSTK